MSKKNWNSLSLTVLNGTLSHSECPFGSIITNSERRGNLHPSKYNSHQLSLQSGRCRWTKCNVKGSCELVPPGSCRSKQPFWSRGVGDLQPVSGWYSYKETVLYVFLQAGYFRHLKISKSEGFVCRLLSAGLFGFPNLKINQSFHILLNELEKSPWIWKLVPCFVKLILNISLTVEHNLPVANANVGSSGERKGWRLFPVLVCLGVFFFFLSKFQVANLCFILL